MFLFSMFVCLLFLAFGIVDDGICSKTVYKIGAIFDIPNEHTEKAYHLAISEASELLTDAGIELEPSIETIRKNSPYQAFNVTCSMIEKGLVGIVGPFSRQNYKVVQSVCDDKDVPLLMLNWDDESLSSVVNLYPHQAVLAQAYIDIIGAWDYEDFVILYENDESLKKLELLIQRFYNGEHRVVAQELNQVGEYRFDLKELAKSGFTHFLIDCSRDVLQEVLIQAQQISIMSETYHFFLTNLDLHTLDLNQYRFGGANITGVYCYTVLGMIRLADPESDYVQQFAGRFAEEEINTGQTNLMAAAWNMQLETLLIRDAVMMIAEVLQNPPDDFQNLAMDCDTDIRWRFGSTIMNSMLGLEYSGVTGLVQFDLKGHRSEFDLDVLELSEGGIRKVAQWTSHDGLNITRIYPRDDLRPKQLSEEHFRVLISQIEPFARLKSSTSTLTGNDRFEGYAIDLIEELSQMEGFSYTFIDQEDKDNGGYNESTKKWTGMVGKIYYGRFADWKNSTRKKYRTVLANLKGTGGGPPIPPEGLLSVLEEKALSLWGRVAVTGSTKVTVAGGLQSQCEAQGEGYEGFLDEPQAAINPPEDMTSPVIEIQRGAPAPNPNPGMQPVEQVPGPSRGPKRKREPGRPLNVVGDELLQLIKKKDPNSNRDLEERRLQLEESKFRFEVAKYKFENPSFEFEI